MKNNIHFVIFLVVTLGFFVSGGVILYLSMKNVLTTQTIQKTQNSQHAVVFDVVDHAKTWSTAIYFIIGNDTKIHRTHIVIGFTNNTTPKVKQILHVRCDESRTQWVIDEYVTETYIAYISRIVVSVVLLFFGVLSLRATIEQL